MKKIFYLMCCVLTAFLVGCESNEPSQSSSSSFVAKPFSVSHTKTVTFSPGNLQYHPANGQWRFAPSQLDYIGNDNSRITSTYNGWIDLFGWGTGDNPTNKSIDNSDYQTFVDWGVNKIGDYAPNTWRTLTGDEWEYIIEKRYNADKLIGIAQVNGVNGLILLPDNWTCSNGITFKSGFHENWCAECYGDYQSFNASDWAILEASGAVFLPAAGAREDYLVLAVQYGGIYWSVAEFDVANFYFRSNEAGCVFDYGIQEAPSAGLSVRLVMD
jgi:hypothetical protein